MNLDNLNRLLQSCDKMRGLDFASNNRERRRFETYLRALERHWRELEYLSGTPHGCNDAALHAKEEAKQREAAAAADAREAAARADDEVSNGAAWRLLGGTAERVRTRATRDDLACGMVLNGALNNTSQRGASRIARDRPPWRRQSVRTTFLKTPPRPTSIVITPICSGDRWHVL